MADPTSTLGPWANLTDLDNNSSSSNITEPVVEQWRKDLDFAATIILTLNTVIFMLGMGAAIYVKELWEHAKKPIGALIGMVGQFIVLPAVGFCLCLIFQLQPYESLGVLMISCCPGGTFSNLFTFWLDGDLALSILMTACSSIVAFGAMPANLWIYSSYWMGDDETTFKLPYKGIMTSLAFITVPAILGMVIRYYHKRTAEITTKVTSVMGWIGVVVGVVVWLILYWQSFVMATPLIYLAAALLPIIGFILSFGISRLTCQTNKIARTVGIETGCQNMPVALSIILLSFKDPVLKSKIMLFPTLYGVMLILQAMVLIGTYQVVKRCCCKDKDEDYPMAYTARVEHGTRGEKKNLAV